MNNIIYQSWLYSLALVIANSSLTVGQELAFLQAHDGLVTFITFSHDGKYMATASTDRTVKIWDFQKRVVLFTIHMREHYVRNMIFSRPDGKYLYIPWGRLTGKIVNRRKQRVWQLHIWDIAKQKRVKLLEEPGVGHRAAALSEDGKLLAASRYPGMIYVYDMESHDILSKIDMKDMMKGRYPNIEGVAIHPTNDFMAIVLNSKAYLVEVKSHKILAKLDVQNRERPARHFFSPVKFSPDGKWLATAAVGGVEKVKYSIKIWNVENKKSKFTLEDNPNGVWVISFSPDSKLLIGGDRDGYLKFWDVQTGKLIKKISFKKPVMALDIHPTGKILAVAVIESSKKFGVKLYDMEKLLKKEEE